LRRDEVKPFCTIVGEVMWTYVHITKSSAVEESSHHTHREEPMPRRYLKVLAALSIGLLGALLGNAQPLSAAEQNPVTAIDILLEPDATMVKHAEAANERLRKSFPEGFALDETHRPHISCLQRYVKTADLDKVYEAVGNVLAEEKPTAWKLKAYKYFYVVWQDIGLAGIVIEPTDDLIRFQKKLIDAIAPFTVKTGTAAAFVTTKEDPEINQPTIDYVATYVPNESGEKFNPHVTIGLASQDYLKEMLDEKFEAFTFLPAGASVYHLGNFGTARKKLKGWELKP
jgi:2'-5' RNA ligase superfamily